MAARSLQPLPESMSFVEASGISTTYGTSYYALQQRAALQPGETLLVTGAAGGVGIAAVQLRQGHGRSGHRRRQQRAKAVGGQGQRRG